MAAKSVLEIGYREVDVTGRREPNFRLSLPLSEKDCGKCVEVTNQGMKEVSSFVASVQNKADRESLLNRISQAVRCMVGTRTIKMIAASNIGEFLNADRCYFVSYDLKLSKMTVEYDWRRDDLDSVAGEYTIGSLSACVEQLKYKTIIIDHLADFKDTVPPYPSTLHPVSLIHIPYSESGELIAALVIIDESGGTKGNREKNRYERWLTDDISLAETIAAQVRSAIDLDRQRTREHNLRTSFRSAVLPELPETLMGMDLSVYYHTTTSETGIGRNFYDVIQISSDISAVVVGEINCLESEIPAKVTTLRHMLRYALYRKISLEETLCELNNIVVQANIVNCESTLFISLYNAKEKSLNYISCGNDVVLIKKYTSDRVSILISTAPPLGVLTTETFASRTIPIENGDTLLIYKNGNKSKDDTNSELSSVSKLIQILRHCRTQYSAQSVLDSVVAGFGSDCDDDICIIAAVIIP